MMTTTTIMMMMVCIIERFIYRIVFLFIPFLSFFFLFLAKKTKWIKSLLGGFIGFHQFLKFRLSLEEIQIRITTNGRIIIKSIFKCLGQIANRLLGKKRKKKFVFKRKRVWGEGGWREEEATKKC